MNQPHPAHVQLCGLLFVEYDGRSLADVLRGPQLQRLFAYLVLNRTRQVSRDELVAAVWGATAPKAWDVALSALFSKLRAALGTGLLTGRGVPVLRFPHGVYVDAERGLLAAHDAAAALARGEHATALVVAAESRYITERTFLQGHDLPWIDEWRDRLADANTRALELHTRSALILGGSELATADRASAQLVERAPYRESVHALRMEVLAATGNCAEALLVYESLRQRLADELGVSPGPELRALHERLLRTTG